MTIEEINLSQRVLNRCRQVHRTCQIGPADPRHTVCTDACKLWIDEKMKACVCLRSLSVHLCGDRCRLTPKVTPDNDGSICPLTCMVVQPNPTVQQVQYTKCGKPIIHWTQQRIAGHKKTRTTKSTPRSKNKRKRVYTNPRASIKVVLSCLQCGINTRATRSHKNVMRCTTLLRKRFNGADKQPVTYHTLRRFFNEQTQLTADAPQLLSPAAYELISSTLSNAIQRYFSMHPTLWIGNNDAAIATMLYLLSEGWILQGVTIVERVNKLRHCLPRIQDIGMVAKLSCRSMSTGTRAFKQYALNKNGLPVYSKRFVLTNAERSELFRAFHF